MREQLLRAMVVVQQPIFRQGVIAILQGMAECEIIGLPTSVGEALNLTRTHEPDVALLDTYGETIDVLELAQHIRTFSPKTAVIVLSDREGEEWLFQAVKVGVAAYVTRMVGADELADTIQKISQGEYVINEEVLFQPNLARRIFPSLPGPTTILEDKQGHLEPSPLSSREVEILEHIAAGNSNKQIAKLLGISDQTVKNHITSILRKLEVNDRTAAAVYAIKHRWIMMK